MRKWGDSGGGIVKPLWGGVAIVREGNHCKEEEVTVRRRSHCEEEATLWGGGDTVRKGSHYQEGESLTGGSFQCEEGDPLIAEQRTNRRWLTLYQDHIVPGWESGGAEVRSREITQKPLQKHQDDTVTSVVRVGWWEAGGSVRMVKTETGGEKPN